MNWLWDAALKSASPAKLMDWTRPPVAVGTYTIEALPSARVVAAPTAVVATWKLIGLPAMGTRSPLAQYSYR